MRSVSKIMPIIISIILMSGCVRQTVEPDETMPTLEPVLSVSAVEQITDGTTEQTTIQTSVQTTAQKTELSTTQTTEQTIEQTLTITTEQITEQTTAQSTEQTAEQTTEQTEEEKSVNVFEIKIGEQTFYAELYDTGAAEEFASLLPMTIDMSELNGNEKYFYLDEPLTVDSSIPDSIHTGDIMLYGSSCLVLFYDDFSTSYSYTPIGHIEDITGLRSALGRGNVTVSFE